MMLDGFSQKCRALDFAVSPLPREISVNRSAGCVDLLCDVNASTDLARVKAPCAPPSNPKGYVMAAKKKAKKKTKKAGKKKARKAATRR